MLNNIITEQYTLEQLAEQIAILNQKVEQLQAHNFTLMTLLGDVIDGVAVSGSIHELSALLDLSKSDLKIAQRLISGYDGDIDKLKNRFINIDGKLCQDNLLPIVQSFDKIGMMTEQCRHIPADLSV